jgi:hypothetical protein
MNTFTCTICNNHIPHVHSKDYWIGVDFDGTLAYTVPNRTDPYQLGEPIPTMIDRVRDWLAKGYTVKLLTARMNYMSSTGYARDIPKMRALLEQWCQIHIGTVIECVNHKDGWMEVLWDDRAVSVDKDTGNATVVALKHRIAELKHPVWKIEWEAISEIAKQLQNRNAVLEAKHMTMYETQIPYAYVCPLGCGCLWRDNHDGTMSLFSNQNSCKHAGGCEYMSLSQLTPLFVRDVEKSDTASKPVTVDDTEEPKVCLTDGSAPSPGWNEIKENGQQVDYLVLCPEERAKGFVRPYRDSYKHTCGCVTTMGRALSETYARNPYFYGSTYCVGCGIHLPVEEFVWTEDGKVVGS